MLKQAAVVFAGVLVATSAALWLTPATHPATAPAARVAPTPQKTGAAATASPDAPGLRGAVQDASVQKAEDGHFWAEAQVNGRHVRFLVDTGATTVALSGIDAERLGLNLASLAYTVPVRTASGEARAAPVKLDYISVAGARVEDIDALVVREGLHASLLGMSYLGRLSRFEATPEALFLRP